MEEALTEKQRYWLEHFKLIDASNQSSAEYAREHNLDAHALYRWRSVLTKQGSLKSKAMPINFAQVKVAQPSMAGLSIKIHFRIPQWLQTPV
ncbi:MAG: hypothetical protein OEY38_16655 [Gammaproteobacteria bacterium]|nr:hypothetical protein [Gammaproteobacteria bacterium]